MRRLVSVCLGALACVGVMAATRASADEPTPTTDVPASTTTTSPIVTPTSESTTTTTIKKGATTTTQKPAGTTTTTLYNGGRPVPPPASGPSQTLVPDLLGTPVVETSTTLALFAPLPSTTLVPAQAQVTANIASHHNSPSGLTLGLAAVSWLASFGGLLVYAEDQRSTRWKHLAR